MESRTLRFARNAAHLNVMACKVSVEARQGVEGCPAEHPLDQHVVRWPFVEKGFRFDDLEARSREKISKAHGAPGIDMKIDVVGRPPIPDLLARHDKDGQSAWFQFRVCIAQAVQRKIGVPLRNLIPHVLKIILDARNFRDPGWV